MTYDDMIISLVKLQYDAAVKSPKKEMDIHIVPLFTRVDIRDKMTRSVRTIIIERTSNFTDLLGTIMYEIKKPNKQTLT